MVGFDLVNDGPISATVRAFCTSTGDIVFGRSLESKCLLSCDVFVAIVTHVFILTSNAIWRRYIVYYIYCMSNVHL